MKVVVRGAVRGWSLQMIVSWISALAGSTSVGSQGGCDGCDDGLLSLSISVSVSVA